MADALAIELHALAAVTAAGTGSSVDLVKTTRIAAKVRLDLVAIAAGAELVVILETSRNDIAWREVRTQTFTQVEQVEWTVGGLSRYVRVRWELTGASASFAVEGEAQVVYCTPRSLERPRRELHRRCVRDAAGLMA
jgi:hypothetical protein